MSIFGRIKSAIFGQAHAATAASGATQSTPSQPGAPVNAQAATGAGQPSSASSPSPASSPATSSAAASPAKPAAAAPVAPTASASGGAATQQPVDVEAVLNAAVAKSGQKLDWRHSIVDFMKALGMDASLAERKDLAAELGYTGDANDSAKMNMFLHKALMQALSENGGKVPAELMD